MRELRLRPFVDRLDPSREIAFRYFATLELFEYGEYKSESESEPASEFGESDFGLESESEFESNWSKSESQSVTSTFLLSPAMLEEGSGFDMSGMSQRPHILRRGAWVLWHGLAVPPQAVSKHITTFHLQMPNANSPFTTRPGSHRSAHHIVNTVL